MQKKKPAHCPHFKEKVNGGKFLFRVFVAFGNEIVWHPGTNGENFSANSTNINVAFSSLQTIKPTAMAVTVC